MVVEVEQLDFIKPPQSLSAERGTVASMMLLGGDRQALAKVRRLLDKTSFFHAKTGTLFVVLCDLQDRGSAIDAVTVREELVNRDVYESIGGAVFLAELMFEVPSSAHVMNYAVIVAERAKEREAIKVCNELIRQIQSPHDWENCDELLSTAARQFRVLGQIGRQLEIVRLGEIVRQYMEDADAGKSESMETGVSLLDSEYRGILSRGGYLIVAARPSMGKSTFLRWMLGGLALNGIPCGLIAREERKKKIAGNYLSSESMIENSRVANPPWGEHEYQELALASGRLEKSLLVVNDSARTIDDVAAVAESMVAEHDCQVIGVDHLHLVATRARYEKKLDRLTDVSEALKDLWKQLGIGGVVAAQLSRPEKGRIPAPPEMTDLRECGAIEEHADAILLLHREDYYYRNHADYTPTGICHVGIAKNRNGPVGGVELRADLAHQRFIEAYAEYPE